MYRAGNSTAPDQVVVDVPLAGQVIAGRLLCVVLAKLCRQQLSDRPQLLQEQQWKLPVTSTAQRWGEMQMRNLTVPLFPPLDPSVHACSGGQPPNSAAHLSGSCTVSVDLSTMSIATVAPPCPPS